MLSADWQGFYGSAYRALVAAARVGSISDEVWQYCINQCERNPRGEEHWEFLAVGYLHLVDRGRTLSSQDLVRLSLLAGKLKKAHRTVNWRLMARVTGVRLAGRRLTKDDLRSIGAVPDHEGYLNDEAGEPSTQYHAYILLLMLRFADDDETVASWMKRSLEWLVRTWQLNGDPSALGRGRFQLFGYAAMSAIAHLAASRNMHVPREWLSAVLSRLSPEEPTGALSSTWTGPFRDKLLRGYNTADDYAAFSELWVSEREEVVCTGPVAQRNGYWIHSLDSSGSCLIARLEGPVAAVTVSDLPLQRGANRLVWHVRRITGFSTNISNAAAYEQAPGSGELTLRSGAFTLTAKADELRWQLAREVLRGGLVEQGRTLWVPAASASTILLCGSVEVEEFRWCRANVEWHGYRARAVRNGHLEIQWRM